MAKIRALLFDKDGTLLDFESTYGAATAKVLMTLAKGDLPLARQLAEPAEFDLASTRFAPGSMIIAGTARDMAAAWADLLGEPDRDALVRRIDTLYLEHSSAAVTPFDYTRGTLDALIAMGLPLGIATNDSDAGARDHAEQAGIADCFAFIAGHDSGYGQKPGPGMVLAFAEATGLEPGEIAMVGDSAHDMQCARAAGALAVAVTSGMTGEEHLRDVADHVLPGIDALPALIARING
ncbi:MAG: HAD family hydrolase [Nitratireductor sp.]|nr:HAD family hydrolase [Nitratireductor sp.]